MLAEDTSSLSAAGTDTAEDTWVPQPQQGSIEELRQRHLALMAAASQQSSKSTELDAQVASTKAELDIILASLIKGLQQPAVSMQLKAYSDLLLQVQAVVTVMCALTTVTGDIGLLFKKTAFFAQYRDLTAEEHLAMHDQHSFLARDCEVIVSASTAAHWLLCSACCCGVGLMYCTRGHHSTQCCLHYCSVSVDPHNASAQAVQGFPLCCMPSFTWQLA